jgi:hypothetical protein
MGAVTRSLRLTERPPVAIVDTIEQLLGDAVQLSLSNARIVVKDAATLMRMDESQLRHALRGDKGYHLSLNRLVQLPFAFWLHFSPALTYLVAKKNVREIAESFALRHDDVVTQGQGQ